MHYEVVASPEEIASGIVSERVTPDVDALARVTALIASKPLTVKGDRGPIVVELWGLLEGSGIREAGMRSSTPLFGPATEQAVRSFQRSRHLAVDGRVGSRTWGVLIWEAIARL